MTIERLRYFSGRLLDAADLADEQHYLREKSRRHNRMLHGWGIVSGLGVRPGSSTWELTVEPGYALDPAGQEIVVDDEVIVDLRSKDEDGDMLAPSTQRDDREPERIGKRQPPEQHLYLAIRYAECAIGFAPDGESGEHSRTRETFAVELLTKLPAAYRRGRRDGTRGGRLPDADSWVILAAVALDSSKNVSSIDCRSYERRVATRSTNR